MHQQRILLLQMMLRWATTVHVGGGRSRRLTARTGYVEAGQQLAPPVVIARESYRGNLDMA